MRLRVVHRTRFHYTGEVTSSYNEARLTPQTGVDQLTLSSAITTSPFAVQQRYWDYWGTQVTAFDLQQPHRELDVTSTSVVDTADPTRPVDVGWGDLDHAALLELLSSSSRAAPDEELTAVALELRGDSTPLEVVEAVAGLVHDRVDYVTGSTAVRTSAAEAWQLGKGVCQDMAHISLALLRAAGVPARYVSGYLHPSKEPLTGEAVAGESHAWIEAWLGGWWGWDPTNAQPAGERHVIVARGRDYGDVTPVKGVYSGGGLDRLEVSVEVTRLG